MTLTYTERNKLEKELQRYGEETYARLLSTLATAAKEDIQREIGHQIDTEKPIILVAPGRSGRIAAQILRYALKDTHKFHRIPIVQIPASVRSMTGRAWEKLIERLLSKEMIAELRRANQQGAQIIFVDAVKGRGITAERYRKMAERLGIPIHKEIIFSEAKSHRIRVLGKHADNYSKIMVNLFDKKRITVEQGSERIRLDVYKARRRQNGRV